MANTARASIKDEDTYDALRDDGYSKESAARIANAQANEDQDPSRRGGHADRYEDRTKDDLYQLAQDRDIDGRSEMTKPKLIEALRNQRSAG
ncbi:MAG: Rho termination factor [Pseudomonadota bacterium]